MIKSAKKFVSNYAPEIAYMVTLLIICGVPMAIAFIVEAVC